MSGSPSCRFCDEPFSRLRPAGEISMTLPVEEQLVRFRMPICMACVRRMMGESIDRAIAELRSGRRITDADGLEERTAGHEFPPANKGGRGCRTDRPPTTGDCRNPYQAVEVVSRSRSASSRGAVTIASCPVATSR